MSKLYVGSEVGQLRRVLLNRPERALTHLTPSNCHELLFDDVLAVEAAGEEHDAFARTLREQDVDFFDYVGIFKPTPLENKEIYLKC